ncbi:hypothetical protein ACFFYR_02095 [Paraburkholderia dipogonis]|nr:hypothetical protein [Paraburkholderia dipogonis]
MADIERFKSATRAAFAIFHLSGIGFVEQTENDFFRIGAVADCL